MTAGDRQKWYSCVLERGGWSLPRNGTVLDFGCGTGDLVLAYRHAGYTALGADIRVDGSIEGLVRISVDPYRLPFPDSTFDLVVSEAVFEHVRDPEVAAREIARVLKPNGITLHNIPSPLAPLEQHIYVPLAGVLSNKIWLRIWATLGIRNRFQRGMAAAEVARRNHDFMHNETNYQSRRQLQRVFGSHFNSVRFMESEALFARPDFPTFLNATARFLPKRTLGLLYSVLHARILVTRCPRPEP